MMMMASGLHTEGQSIGLGCMVTTETKPPPRTADRMRARKILYVCGVICDVIRARTSMNPGTRPDSILPPYYLIRSGYLLGSGYLIRSGYLLGKILASAVTGKVGDAPKSLAPTGTGNSGRDQMRSEATDPRSGYRRGYHRGEIGDRIEAGS